MFQESKELTITTAPRTGKWHELAEAIRRGSLLFPQGFDQCFTRKKGTYEIIGACALGAAVKAGFGDGSLPIQPRCDCPACGDRNSIMIQHLNDDHRWTRERIADWLDQL